MFRLSVCFIRLGAAQRAECHLAAPTPKNPDAERVLRPVGPADVADLVGWHGLILVSMTARSVVEDPLAFTELKLVFRNPEPRQIEGQFEITLPPGAAISRLRCVLATAGKKAKSSSFRPPAPPMRLPAPSPRPGAAGKQAGNQFRARVFPIPPSAEKS